MSLASSIKNTVQENIEIYEGRIPHLYLDVVGRVTVGIGHLVTHKNAIADIPMYHSTSGLAATTDEKLAEYSTIEEQEKSRPASYYKRFTKLEMKDTDINAQRDKHIDSFYSELCVIYKVSNGYPHDFDNLPENVQIALFDMIFNLGASKIVKVFVKFDAAIKAGDWQQAARQSRRPQVSDSRNQYVENLLQTAM